MFLKKSFKKFILRALNMQKYLNGLYFLRPLYDQICQISPNPDPPTALKDVSGFGLTFVLKYVLGSGSTFVLKDGYGFA
jgi:selenophosphate synthase